MRLTRWIALAAFCVIIRGGFSSTSLDKFFISRQKAMTFAGEKRTISRQRRYDNEELREYKEGVKEECCWWACDYHELEEFREDIGWEKLHGYMCELSIREGKTCKCQSSDKDWKLCGSDKMRKKCAEPHSGCFKRPRRGYRGTKSTTREGKTCQKWSAQYPHAHSKTPKNYKGTGLDENYCRNPTNAPYGPWCYTTDPGYRWDYCFEICIVQSECKRLCGVDGTGNCVGSADGYFCRCNDGFKGTNCEININECQSGPCRSGGTCVDGINSFSCRCVPGWQGTLCEININECQSGPCQNGGTCVDGINSFSCRCVPGWQGTKCEIDINECQSGPCQNGGNCVDGINSYSCHCVPGWQGTKCEININECRSGPCQNGGACVDGINSFSCHCAPGWQGTKCEIDINECRSGPCQNGGTCVDGINSFSCRCAPGWQGTKCEIDIDECEGQSCSENGQCEDGINDYKCICNVGFTGKDCETDIDECEGQSCNENGQCEDGINDYKCICNDGFKGKDCETEFLRVRLVDADGNENSELGRLEVFQDGIWKPVCNYFHNKRFVYLPGKYADAQDHYDSLGEVVCRMLGKQRDSMPKNDERGYPNIPDLFPGIIYNTYKFRKFYVRPKLYDEVYCYGTEATIFDCTKSKIHRDTVEYCRGTEFPSVYWPNIVSLKCRDQD